MAPQEAPNQLVAGAHGARMAVLIGPEQGEVRFGTRRSTLDPGGRIPAHRHDAIEHQKVVVRGEMVLTLDGVERLVRAGDAVFIPAGTAPACANRLHEQVEFLCTPPATSDDSTEWLEGPCGGVPTNESPAPAPEAGRIGSQ